MMVSVLCAAVSVAAVVLQLFLVVIK